MKLKKLYILLIILFSFFLLMGCKDKKFSIKVGDYKYNPEEYTVSVEVDFTNFNSDDKVIKYGILYELTKVKKITSLNFDSTGVYAIEAEADSLNNGKVTFVIENVNKYLTVNFISVRPYVIQQKDILEEKTLSTAYKVLQIDGKYIPEVTEPENPIITEVHINSHVKGEKNYTVTTDDKRVTVLLHTPIDYINIKISIMANNGYTFDENVVLYDNDELVEAKRYTIINNGKEIYYLYADPNWTPVY